MVMLRQREESSRLAAWGFGRDGEGWWRRAACAETAELHTAELSPSGWRAPGSVQAQARHICLHHCLVLDQCARDAQRQTPCGVTQAGIVWVTAAGWGGRPSSTYPPDPGCGQWCEHLRGQVAA